ncbi:hypothetical protein [Caulobacter hibisci]|uniref:Uncharacterized protein n=1 Tax=Caulobacter hibisci TaxID=2035993 RepID=A0ABS0ST32_9CAUL|nr:hypothetical protein [Caulobacter hibisci]MBI1682366.1 hypothetical protein [Caulobacter hibisci]
MSRLARAAALALLVATPAIAAPVVVVGPGNSASKRYTGMSNSYRWLDGKERDLNGLRLSKLYLTVTRGVVRIANGQSDVVIKDSTFILAKPQTGDSLPVAVEVVDGHDVLIERVTARNWRMEPVKGAYLNGDCFSGERLSYNVTLRQTYAIGCSDGGYDFKTTGLVLDRVTAEDVGFCLRIWGSAKATTVACKAWREGAVQVKPGASITIDTLKIFPAAGKPVTLFGVGKGATLIVKKCEGKLPAGSTVLFYQEGASAANTTVKLGATCL